MSLFKCVLFFLFLLFSGKLVASECKIVSLLSVVNEFVCEKSTTSCIYHKNGRYAGQKGSGWYYSDGKYAGAARGGWYYNNGKYAGSMGSGWYHDNGNYAGSNNGAWYYSNGKYAGSKNSIWYNSKGAYVGSLSDLTEADQLQIVLRQSLD